VFLAFFRGRLSCFDVELPQQNGKSTKEQGSNALEIWLFPEWHRGHPAAGDPRKEAEDRTNRIDRIKECPSALRMILFTLFILSKKAGIIRNYHGNQRLA
jgi:hypothetical protein